MSIFENDDFPLQEENYGDNTNFMENTPYIWSNSAYVPSREPLIPSHPRLTTLVDQGSQYIDPLSQPLIRPMTSLGRNTPPMFSAHTQTDLPFDRLVVTDNQNVGQNNLNQPSTLGQNFGYDQNFHR